MKHSLQALLIAPDDDMRERILRGDKKISIREGERDYRPGEPMMVCCHLVPWAVMVDVTDVRHTTLGMVTEAEWTADGFESYAHLMTVLKQFYPRISYDSAVTVVNWANARGELVDSYKK